MLALGASSVAQDWEKQHPVPDFAPLHDEADWHPWQWRAKVTRYSAGGFELSLHLRDRERAKASWEKYGGFGAPRKFRAVGEAPDPDNLKRARYRRRTAVRQLSREKCSSHLLTLTTREKENTRDSILASWARFLRLYERAWGARLDFIAVLELHPSNLGHVHLHAAVTSYIPVQRLRRLWYIALGGRGNERGASTPGGVNMKYIAAKNPARRSARIAKYISGYMTKETALEFNKKAYSSSRGSVPESEGWWLSLDGLAPNSLNAALSELGRLFGLTLTPEDAYLFPSGRGAHFSHVPGDAQGAVGKWYGDPPPF